MSGSIITSNVKTPFNVTFGIPSVPMAFSIKIVSLLFNLWVGWFTIIRVKPSANVYVDFLIACDNITVE